MVKKATVAAARVNMLEPCAQPCCSRQKYSPYALDLGPIDKELERLAKNAARATKVLALAKKVLEEAQSDETE